MEKESEHTGYTLESTPDITIRLGSLALENLEGIYSKLEAQRQRITRDMGAIRSEIYSRHERLFDDSTE